MTSSVQDLERDKQTNKTKQKHQMFVSQAAVQRWISTKLCMKLRMSVPFLHPWFFPIRPVVSELGNSENLEGYPIAVFAYKFLIY